MNYLSPTKYFGTARNIRSLENYHLSISKHEREDEIPRHRHKNPYLSLNIGAPYLENDGTAQQLIKSGTVILRPAHYEHENRFSKNLGLCFNIELTSKNNKEIIALFAKKNIQFSSFEILEILIKSFNHCSDNELDCLISKIFFQVLQYKNSLKYPDWYFKVVDKVRHDYNNSISLSSIADYVSLHPNYLARKFKRLNGSTLGDFIRKTRLENACLKLCSNERLTDISLNSGFYDQSHFSNSFRSAFQITPKRLKHFFRLV